jgi:hypothetical protein
MLLASLFPLQKQGNHCFWFVDVAGGFHCYSVHCYSAHEANSMIVVQLIL